MPMDGCSISDARRRSVTALRGRVAGEMRRGGIYWRGGGVFGARLVGPAQGGRAQGGERPATQATPPPAAIGEYRRELEEYTSARRKYEAEADAYWSSVADKRRLRLARRRNNQEIGLGDYVSPSPRSIPVRRSRSIPRRRSKSRRRKNMCPWWPTSCAPRQRNSTLFPGSRAAKSSTSARTLKSLPPPG